MELLAPDPLLIIWTLLSLVHILLSVIAIIKLTKNKRIDPSMKLIWLLAIIFLPFAGSILFLRSYFQPGKVQEQKK
jgi:hypothetical protein